MPELVFRKADKLDIPSIKFIEKYSFYPYLYRSNRYFNNLVNNGFLYVVIVDDILAGYMSFTVHRKFIEVRDLAVMLGYRRQGISSQFFDIVFSVARFLNKRKIKLTVDELNEPARSLYTKLGFVEDRVRKKYYGNSNGILMSVILLK